MSLVQSVIPICAALIIVAEVTHLVDLVADARRATASRWRTALSDCADALH